MIAEREALRMGIEHLTVLFSTEVSSFDFQVECTDRTVQYKLNAQSLRLFGLHRDVNDAHRASATRLQHKNKQADRENSWLCEESDLRNRAFHEDRARDCQEIEEIRRIWCAEADRVRQLKYSELSTTERETLYRKSAFGSDSGSTRQGEFLE